MNSLPPMRRFFSRTPWMSALVLLMALRSLPATAQVRKVTLTNGTRLLVQTDTNSDTVAVSVFIAMSPAEEQRTPGIGRVIAQAIFGSNRNQSRDAVNRTISEAGGSLESRWTPDYTLLTCQTTRDALPDALYVIAQALIAPEFAPEMLQESVQRVRTDLARENSEPYAIAYDTLRSVLYQNSPYRLPFHPAADTLRVTPAAAERFFTRTYLPQNTVISLIGNITPEKAQTAVENALLPQYDRTASRPLPAPEAEHPWKHSV